MKNADKNLKTNSEMKRIAAKSAICLVLAALGIAGCVSWFFLPQSLDIMWKYVILATSGALFLSCVIALAVLYGKMNKKPEPVKEEQDVIDVNVEDNGSGGHVATVTYPAENNTYRFVNMGQRQSVEEKFEQIALMDKTQFVIYCARLFGLNGYSVKITPVLSNRSVDLVVEKGGETIAVGCVKSDRLLSEQDVRPVAEGSAFYNTSKSMVFTNMYFDKTAVAYAAAHNVALVDRTVVIQNYML